MSTPASVAAVRRVERVRARLGSRNTAGIEESERVAWSLMRSAMEGSTAGVGCDEAGDGEPVGVRQVRVCVVGGDEFAALGGMDAMVEVTVASSSSRRVR